MIEQLWNSYGTIAVWSWHCLDVQVCWPFFNEEAPNLSPLGLMSHGIRQGSIDSRKRACNHRHIVHKNEDLLSGILIKEREMQIMALHWFYLYPGIEPLLDWCHNFALCSTCQQELPPLFLFGQINVPPPQKYSVHYSEPLIQEIVATESRVSHIIHPRF